MASPAAIAPRRNPTWFQFSKRQLLIRTLPFVLVAVAGEASLSLLPGPLSQTEIILSVVLLALTAIAFVLPWAKIPQWLDVFVPLLYVGSSLALILAARGSATGVGLVVLLPIVWAALNLNIWKSAAVVVSVAVIELVTTYVPVNLSNSVRLQREIAFVSVGGLIAYSFQQLRRRISLTAIDRASMNKEMMLTISELHEQNRTTSLLSEFVEMLTFCDTADDAYEVFEHSAREIFQTAGSICFVSPSSGMLETKCAWLESSKTQDPFPPEWCFAFRQAQPYESNSENPRCQHIHSSDDARWLCQPLTIQREVMGLLIISIPEDSALRGRAQDEQKLERYAQLIGDQISIWIANVRLRDSLRDLSTRDPLTNLFNRRFMIETLRREMIVAARSMEPVSIIQIDIDHFKKFNDMYGHEVGDTVLRAVADVMFGLFRESDVPCRSGGEEFTLILPKCSWEIANLRAQELQFRVSVAKISIDATQAPLAPPTLSIGIATSPENGLSGEQLLRGADLALYSAKSAGRNQIVRAAPVDQSAKSEWLSSKERQRLP